MIIRRDILSELPLSNIVFKLVLTGVQVWDDLENGVSYFESNVGRFPQFSGVSFIYNPRAKAGLRIIFVKK